MKPCTRTLASFLLFVPLCLSFSLSHAQLPRIVGKPLSAYYEFASAVAQTLKLGTPDSSKAVSGKHQLQIILKETGNEAKWIVLDFNRGANDQADYIESVSITGHIPDIIELYALLYDSSVRKVKPSSVYTAVDRDGEITKIRTDFKSIYDEEEGFFGRIHIIKSNQRK